jgi:hypothetical protein
MNNEHLDTSPSSSKLKRHSDELFTLDVDTVMSNYLGSLFDALEEPFSWEDWWCPVCFVEEVE